MHELGIAAPLGFVAGGVYAGLKTAGPGVLDLGLLACEVECSAAGLFTRNKVCAAPVLLCRERITKGKARAVVVNSGCANACTGERGLADAREMAALAAATLGVAEAAVLVASTGIIGQPLPMEKIRRGIGEVVLSREGGSDFARAIVTTDSRLKVATRSFAALPSGKGSTVTVAGAAKGAGMIHPDMATMLVFLTSDARAWPQTLQACLRRAVDRSFHMLTVDGDTSTNDSVLLLASGLATGGAIEEDEAYLASFQAALDSVCIELAQAIASDAEGATRLIEVVVRGAASDDDARLAARTIVGSSLVKSAVHGCDPNWGRILAAAGRSGCALEEAKVGLHLGAVEVMRKGEILPFDPAQASAALQGPRVLIALDLGLGAASATAWGCDLSEEYVTFNSAYTT